MLLFVFLVVQAFLFVILCAAYNRRDEVLWGLGAVLAGILSASALSVDFTDVTSKGLSVYGYADMPLVAFNLAILLICVVWMFLDAYSNHGNAFRVFEKLKPARKV